MKMLNDNVLVTTNEEHLEQTDSGLFIPTKKKSYKRVTVVEPDKDNELSKGEVLVVPKSSGIEYEEFLIINKREIISID
ncbi:MAG: hypothetical protein HRU18_03620 [Pseudoalteromonas sp.]|uniref:hypothetical protein n=1 Tax=Pseudoalteromonas sp. TaxID=53249 RepID=UPI001D5BF863|nr:hypothetical protein [Pseudoalteromonas sp.]NRA77275.1 hypothetical protein [Pseudoalteromonas sp.]